MEGPVQPEWCVLGLQACSKRTPCPLHDQWVPLREEIQRLLEETTLASLAHTLRRQVELGEVSSMDLRVGTAQRRPAENKRRKAS